MTNRHTTGQTGEALIGAELARNGFTIAFPTGNAQSIDILAYRNGEIRAVQVKTVSKGSLQVDLGKFVDIEFEGDAGHERQIVRGPLNAIDVKIDFVVVFLGQRLGEDKIRCTTLGDFATFASNSHSKYLNGCTPPGVRPGRNKKSLHAAFKQKDIIECCKFREFSEYFHNE